MSNLTPQKKPKIDIIVPSGTCACTFARWMDQVWSILMEYREKIDYETFSSNSKRAGQLGIIRNGIAVNGKVTLVNKLELEIMKYIPKEQ